VYNKYGLSTRGLQKLSICRAESFTKKDFLSTKKGRMEADVGMMAAPTDCNIQKAKTGTGNITKPLQNFR
jgi:hypothetical protein